MTVPVILGTVIHVAPTRTPLLGDVFRNSLLSLDTIRDKWLRRLFLLS
jgi:hypothetical protein